MINAKEALDLYNTSLYTLQQYLTDNFHSGIRSAAMAGKREYTVHLDSKEGWWTIPPLAPLQEKAVAELKKLGFGVIYGFYGESYVPRGLADDDGDGPSHRNYGIVVTW